MTIPMLRAFYARNTDSHYVVPVIAAPTEHGWTQDALAAHSAQHPNCPIWVDIEIVTIMSGPNKGKRAIIKWGGQPETHTALTALYVSEQGAETRWSRVLGFVP